MIKVAVAVSLGGLLGFAYHKLVGCASGGCPIVANPYMSILYGGLVGLILTTGP
ncbi:DUF6132 family protein [Elusimicrobiota bacterium]